VIRPVLFQAVKEFSRSLSSLTDINGNKVFVKKDINSNLIPEVGLSASTAVAP